jgi:hypothetical protein
MVKVSVGGVMSAALMTALAVGGFDVAADGEAFTSEPARRRKPQVQRDPQHHAEIVEWNRKVEEKRRAKKAQKGKSK